MSNLWNNPIFFWITQLRVIFLLSFLCLELTHSLIGTLLINLLFLQHRIISWQILQLQHRITNLQLCNMGWVNDISWTDASQMAKPDIYAYIPIIVFAIWGRASNQTQNLPQVSRLFYHLFTSTSQCSYGNPYGFDINVWIAIFNDHEQTCQGKKKITKPAMPFSKAKTTNSKFRFMLPPVTSYQLLINGFEDLTTLIRLVSFLTNTGTVVVGIMRNASPNWLEHAILKFGLACS